MINKRERKSPRLKDFDYLSERAYFITINTKNSVSLFGDISCNEVILNEYGKIVENCWYDLENHYFNCILDEFLIMPNHVHGIIFIDNDIFVGDDDRKREGHGKREGLRPSRTEEKEDADINKEIKIHGLPEMIRAFKSFSSRRINEIILLENNINLGKFQWHRSFHDHIIRNEKSYLNIQNYIINNPKNWENDRNHINQEILF